MSIDTWQNGVMKINNFIKIYVIIFFQIMLQACTTVTTFEVKSEPAQADVYMTDEKGEKKLIGKTPLQLTEVELKKNLGNNVISGEFFTVTVEKDGFVNQTFQIPSSVFASLISKLDVVLVSGKSNAETVKTAKDIIDQLFLAQKFALSQQFERAHIELDKVLVAYPHLARVHSMRGGIFYAQKKYDESLRAYNLALQEDPQLDEAIKMIAKLKTVSSSKDNSEQGIKK